MPIACAYCKSTVAELKTAVLPELVTREVSVILAAFDDALAKEGVGAASPRLQAMEPLRAAFLQGLPVDLCFSPQLPAELDLSQLQDADSEYWTNFVGRLHCAPPTVAELFTAAWLQRLDIQYAFQSKLPGFSSRKELVRAIEDSVESIFYLGENLLTGLRSLWLLRYLERVLSYDPH